MTSIATQQKRRQALVKLLERYIPDNSAELLAETQIPACAALARSRDGDWISLHETAKDALSYFAQDDSNYVPAGVFLLETGEERLVESTISYRLGETVRARA